jgi:hypothetical protein
LVGAAFVIGKISFDYDGRSTSAVKNFESFQKIMVKGKVHKGH